MPVQNRLKHEPRSVVEAVAERKAGFAGIRKKDVRRRAAGAVRRGEVHCRKGRFLWRHLAGGLLVAALVDVQASSGAPAAVSTVQRPRRPACTIWTSILLGSP